MSVKLKAVAALSFLGALLLIWLANQGSRDDLPLTLLRVSTNEHGLREYEVTLENRAWNCLLDPKVWVCADPLRAKARAKNHQGARLWPSMQMIDSKTRVTSSTGTFLAKGQTAALRFLEPADGPWMLSVYCVRTNTSPILLAFAAANAKANVGYGVPLIITLESATHRNSELFERR